MTFKMADRVQETTTTSGVGSLTLHGAVAGFQSFAATLAVGDTTYYAISDPVALAWEIGLGTFGAGNTLGRTTVLASSNSGGLIALAGNAGTQVWQDMPASVLAALIASQGTLGSVTDGVTSVTNASTIDFTSGATVTNAGGVAQVAISGGTSSLEVMGGGGTVTNVSALSITSGGTVSSGGTGVALLAISGGGGGGSYTAGLGIYFSGTSPTTIGNTGTINLPSVTGAVPGAAIDLRAASVTDSTAAGPLYAGAVLNYGGRLEITNTLAGAQGGGGEVASTAGDALCLPSYLQALGAAFRMNSGYASVGQFVKGGDAVIAGGYASPGYSAVTNIKGGNITIATGAAYKGQGGSVNISLGGGLSSAVGGLIINDLGTVDPHILNQAWLGVDNGITLSSG